MPIQLVMLRANITFVSPPPQTEIIRMENISPGKAVIMSMNREMTKSVRPPTYPARLPNGTPIERATIWTAMPTVMEVRAP